MDSESIVKLEKIKNKKIRIIIKYFKFRNLKIIKGILIFILIIFLLCTIINKEFLFKLSENSFKLSHHNRTYISEKIKLLKQMTNNDENEFKGIKNCLEDDPDNLCCIYHLINPKSVVGKKRILIGKKIDGCYVLLDDLRNIKIAYSIGISDNIIFDIELAKRGIDVYMYDHTINSLPLQNEKFHWKKIGLAGKKTNNTQMKTLEELIEENGHTSEKNMILKMDIESYEWESLIDLKEEILNQFKYIAIEYHFADEKNATNTDIYYKVIKKIYKTHQPFYTRCNGDRSFKVNFGNNRICHIMEVSYIIRQDNLFKKDDTVYPIYEFDYSQIVPGKLEMNLNLLKLFD